MTMSPIKRDANALDHAYEKPIAERPVGEKPIDEKSGAAMGEALGSAIGAVLVAVADRLAKPEISAHDIHMARRDCKTLRALASLATAPLSALGQHTADAANRARRCLGGARDADVRQETLERLQPLLQDHYSYLTDKLGLADEPERPAPAALALAHRALTALARDWRLADVQALQTDDIVKKAVKTYRRALKRAKRTADGETKALHRLRSAIVDHEIQMRFLSAFAPSMQRQSENAHRLRKVLGDLNDVEMTMAFLTPLLDDPKDERAAIALTALRAAGGARRENCLGKARSAMQDVLQGAPEAFENDLKLSL